MPVRKVVIDTPEQLLAEIQWCLAHGGDFVYAQRRALSRGHCGDPWNARFWVLRHEDYPYFERKVKHHLARQLERDGRIYTPDPYNTFFRRYYISEE